MNAPDQTPRRNPGWVGRYLVYLGLLVGIPWLAAELAFQDCARGSSSGGENDLCGLAYVAVTPIAGAIVLVGLLGVEIVWWSRRSRR